MCFLALICTLTLTCILFRILWQVGAKCPVQLHFLLCRADRRYLGQRRRRDRKGGRRGAFLFTNHHQLRQPDAKPEVPESPLEEEQPPPKARGRRNPARNRRRPPCGTESPGHRH
ncbi:hypothetical protein Gotur_036103 [Gossypium turneri]